MLEHDLKSAALKEGAIRVGIARRESSSGAPPSADMRYEKPWANAVVSFALPPCTEWIEDYLGRITRMVLKKKMFDINHELYRIGAIIEERLDLRLIISFRMASTVPITRLSHRGHRF